MATPDPVPAPAGEAGALLQSGRRMLQADDLPGIAGLLGALARLRDADRRLWATLALLDQALLDRQAPGAAHAADMHRLLLAAGLDLLEHEPCEPELLWRAGQLLDLLGKGEAAGALQQAARRLGPGLGPKGDAGAGLEQAERRREPGEGGAGAGSSASAVAPGFEVSETPESAELSQRALALAERVQPATGLRLSLCMIVRDEQEALPRCLESVAGVVDEIVIVDTGSTDSTVAIARSFGAQVIASAWEGSFAQARNVSFDAAQGDWIVFLDADEMLHRGDGERLRALTARTWCEAFRMAVINHTGSLADGTSVTHNALRMFRNRPQYRFQGRLHEQIAEQLPSFLPARLCDSGVRIEHYGYLDDVRRQRGKSQRNIELLMLEQREGPPSAFLHFNLGSERMATGEHGAALVELDRAWTLLREGDDPAGKEFAPALALRLVAALRAVGRSGEARVRAREGLELFPDFTDLVFEQALASAADDQRQTAIELFERCLEMGVPPTRYPSSAGRSSYLAHMELGRALREAGDLSGAERELELAIEANPALTRARVTLAEVRLAQRRYEDAWRELGGVLPDDPHALSASRTELFALIAAGAVAHAAVGTAFARAAAAGMGASEIELFQGWRALIQGEGTELVPSPAGAARLLGMLETLLQARDFEGFEQLSKLLDRSTLSARERRQALAEMYLRRGFLASAAEEWMAVCRDTPDSRALLGLAQVALARGMEQEAGEFAGAALEQDPANSSAAALLCDLQPIST